MLQLLNLTNVCISEGELSEMFVNNWQRHSHVTY